MKSAKLEQLSLELPVTVRTDHEDALTARMQSEMLRVHRCVACQRVKLRTSRDEWLAWFEGRPEWESLCWDSSAMAWNAEMACLVKARFSSQRSKSYPDYWPDDVQSPDLSTADRILINVHVYGARNQAARLVDEWERNFDRPGASVEWYYAEDGRSVSVPLREDRSPLDAMFPFLGRPLRQYWNEYLQSSASILVLIGAPGTGKTSFIRGLLQYSQRTAMVTYSAELLSKDELFSNFVSGSEDILVMEDADEFLRARDSGGNDMMHRFLSVGDGLVTISGKKMIFSTNLEHVNDIDPALLRKGRCFDVVRFRALSPEEALALARQTGRRDPSGQSSYTLADIMSDSAEVSVSRATVVRMKTGFLTCPMDRTNG